MSSVMNAVLPGIIAVIAVAALCRRVDLFGALAGGAAEGVKSAIGILPTLVVLFVAIFMFRASGALDALTRLLAPVASVVGIPPECLPLALLRPFSGSGTLALGAEVIATHGVNSLVGRTAAVMLGSTETTFYVIAVYSGGAGVKNTRHAIPAALVADVVGFIAASLSVRLLM